MTRKNYLLRFLLLTFILFVNTSFSQETKSDRFDIGKMWTFESAPVDYFAQTYNFRPTQEWLDNVRLSAMRFGNGCSSSFISEDGLVMTNHHCGRGYVTQISKPGEELSKTGFIAAKLEDERPVPGLFVDQLIKVIDVTKEIQDAMETGGTDAEKSKMKTDKIKEIEKKYSAELNLKCNVITFYNGGMYSLYCYKRYTDVRLVFAPENYVAHYGGDPDNFTYPRYDFDCMFFRVYDNGKPMKSPNYFRWSKNGAKVGEPVFVIGNPGSTERLKTYAQLEFARDFTVPTRLETLDFMCEFLSDFLDKYPERTQRYQDALFGNQNSQKVFVGQKKALNDPVMMARKKDFEDNIKSKVFADANLKAKYGNVWSEIEKALDEYRKFYTELQGYELLRNASKYYLGAWLVFKNASEGKETSDSLINLLYKNFDPEYNKVILDKEIELMLNKLGKDNQAVVKAFGNRSKDEIVDYILATSNFRSLEKALEFSKSGTQNILSSNDPLIKYLAEAKPKHDELLARYKDIQARIDVNSSMLGRVLFDIYGTTIPPDATLTLRISDGEIKSYPYNGTIAPPFTTFYGIYDRYYSHGKKYPWLLPERWLNPPKEFNLATEYNLVTTNDIIGGNSGSPLINTNAEVVGLVFDGNIESLPGRYIYTTELNRTVAVDSRGLLEAIKNLYKASRLSNEILNGKLGN
ncbi:MAG: S46 family peptidase [Ignavibacteriae bacterium]|nr:S46 family peptidase [Ignavibacteriota bacterium]